MFDERVFDTVDGLPLHVLLVHGVVVGVPVMALATVLVAARPPWRMQLGWAVVVLNAGLFALTLATKQAGEALQERVGAAVVAEHSRLGDVMPWFVLGLLAVSVLVPIARHRRPMAAAVLALCVVVAAANVFWVVRTGESGSRAVWGGVVENTTP